jgi:hypothetical protein
VYSHLQMVEIKHGNWKIRGVTVNDRLTSAQQYEETENHKNPSCTSMPEECFYVT